MTTLKNCYFEFFLGRYKSNYDSAFWLLLDLSDMLFYLNRDQNTKTALRFSFPKLTNVEYDASGNDFISAGRVFCNRYFPKYSGPVFHLYYGDELKELFAIASNALAFLYRTRDRAKEELELAQNYFYSAQIDIYPRFNNCIAEVAGTLYAAWERIAFLLNEFFPHFPNAQMAPSFKRYVQDQVKNSVKDNRLQNPELDWFNQRIQGDHLRLEDLRHPTVHYNDSRSPSGTRAVEMMKNQMDDQSIAATKRAWAEELNFLTSELKAFDDALPRAITLLNKWASALGY